jgi:hypothetical protein
VLRLFTVIYESIYSAGFLRWERLRLEWLKPVAGQAPRKRKSNILYLFVVLFYVYLVVISM